MDRVRAWLAAAPLLATGVVAAHEVAYRITATPARGTHGYLEHTPQVLVAVTAAGLVLAAVTGSTRTPAAWLFPFAGLLAFACQEHVEAIFHGGELPFLLTSPAFLLGMLLQLPFALAAWLLTRTLLSLLEDVRPRRARLPRTLLAGPPPVAPRLGTAPLGALPGRGPPTHLRR